MKCSGVEVMTGSAVEISASAVIDGVDHVISPPPGLPFVAPGFIDIQVNGFAGVDYCAPDSAMQEIGRSIRMLHSTGVTRFFPTVITGSPENMAGGPPQMWRGGEA